MKKGTKDVTEEETKPTEEQKGKEMGGGGSPG